MRRRGTATGGEKLRERFVAWAGPLFAPGATVTVGLSGGIDSVVLLDLLWQSRDALRVQLHALHVHHGLSPNADNWVEFCRRLTARRGIPLRIFKVDISPYRERGLEGAAREARYRAFAQAEPGYLALAHHADDQAETFLLQLLRGSGPAGLAAMPAVRTLTESALQVVRPLLEVRRTEIAAYARTRRLRWVEDESNEDTARLRNAIRHEILPRIEAFSPGAVAGINRSARLVAEAAEIAQDVAATDLAAASRGDSRGASGGNPRGAAGSDPRGASLDLQSLRALSRARAVNALRLFLEQAGLQPLSFAQTAELWSQLTRGRADANVAFALQGWMVRCYRGTVLCEPPRASSPGRASSPDRAGSPGHDCAWDGSNPWRLQEPGGLVVFEPVQGAGIRSHFLSSGHRVEVRARGDARLFKPQGSVHRRMLKKLFQEANIPSWQRSRLPFLYIDEALSWIPGIGVGADFAAGPGEPGWQPQWWPDRPDDGPAAVSPSVQKAAGKPC